MKNKIFLAIISSLMLIVSGSLILKKKEDIKNKFIVITDLEPDDRIALHILAAKIPEDEILFVGATLKNSALKKELTEKLLQQLNFKNTPVYQGSGGSADSYYDINSSRAARTYVQEGENILSDEKLASLRSANYSSKDLQEHIEKALRENEQVKFILLAPPTDLVAALDKNPELRKNINHIYIMGGWSEFQENGQDVLRTTYNWNMDPESSAKLMKMNDIPMTLYSSHSIKKFFSGGTCNINNCPDIINCMNKLRVKLASLRDQMIASLAWDDHIITSIPELKEVINPFKGQQFTPADPLVIIGITNPLISAVRNIDVDIDLSDLDLSKGFRVNVSDNKNSKIRLVEDIDIDVFTNEVVSSFFKLVSFC